MLLLHAMKLGGCVYIGDNLPSKFKGTSKSRGLRLWLGCITALLGFPLLLYYGYCWGLWGRQSLLLQYLFQCNCPPASEEARYPEQVDVIVPACHQSYVELSPSGRLLKVNQETSGFSSSYLLDLQTMQEVPAQSFSGFLTDDLWLVEKGLEDYIINRTTGEQYPIKIFRLWQDNSYVNEEPNLELLISALQQAEQIFFTQNNDTVVVLMPNHSKSFTFDRSDIPGGEPNKVDRFLQENNISYQSVVSGFMNELVSPDGRFVARTDGIYLIETGQKITEGYSLSVRGWIYDGSGVIYSHALGRCLLRVALPFTDDIGCFRRVPQPVLKLNVPEEYLLPEETP
jgi:hypothetical protein